MEPKHICFWMRRGLDGIMTIRARQFGIELYRRGWTTSYIIDDIPANVDAQIDGASEICHIPVKGMRSFRQGVRGAIKKITPDYIHILNPSLAHAYALTGKGTPPLIVDFEDCHALKFGGFQGLVSTMVERWALRKATKVIAVSRELQDRFYRLGRSDTGYVPYGILPRSLPVGDSPFDEPTAVWMGSFQRVHDLLFITDMAYELQRIAPQVKVVMIGGGRDWQHIENVKKERRLDNLHLTGKLPWDEMLLRLRHAHVLLLPLKDNMDNKTRCPFKALQYAQAKRPVIATEVGEVPFMLGPQARYEKYDPSAFANAVAELALPEKLPDLDYDLESHAWSDRASRLIETLESSPQT